MIGRWFLLVAATVPTLAATPAAYPPVAFNALWPPAADGSPPAPADPRFSPAPVPNLNIDPPLGRAGQKARTELTPQVFGGRLPRSFLGDGYTPGSSVDDDLQKRQRLQQLAPGLNLSVPLQ